MVSETGNILKREDGYLFVHRVRMLSGVDDPQVMEIEVLKSSVYGLCNKWCLVELHFHTVTTASVEKKRSIPTPLWVAQKNASAGLTMCKTCSRVNPSHEAPTRG